MYVMQIGKSNLYFMTETKLKKHKNIQMLIEVFVFASIYHHQPNVILNLHIAQKL